MRAAPPRGAARRRQCAAARPDAIARLRQGADAMTTRAASLKKLADAAEPLYKSLDDGQKRRFAVLLHMGGRPARPRPLAAPRRQPPLRRHPDGGGGHCSSPTIAARQKPPGPFPAAFLVHPRRRGFSDGPHCWTVPRRFATARRLAGLSRIATRAHSSVGRAADS